MRPFRIAIGLSVVVFTALGSTSLHAAWDNVFQVCCFNCRSSTSYYYPSTAYYVPATSYYTPSVAYYVPTTAYYAPATVYSIDPCCPAPCAPVCTTQMVQRSYYQPVTHYENRTQYEAVTSYRTSYYYEPVTSYRISSFYDPCSCSYRQMSTAYTAYQLRAQACPVQSWVARCVSVPVTTQQLVTYYEPVSTCSAPTTLAPAPVAAPTQAPCTTPTIPPTNTGVAPSGGMGINEQRAPLYRPGEGPSSGAQQSNPMPPAGTGFSRQYTPAPARPAPPVPAVRLDGFVVVPAQNVEGELVRADRTADAGARLMFKRVDRQGESQSVKTDRNGRFRTTLTAGVWDVYTR